MRASFNELHGIEPLRDHRYVVSRGRRLSVGVGVCRGQGEHRSATDEEKTGTEPGGRGRDFPPGLVSDFVCIFPLPPAQWVV